MLNEILVVLVLTLLNGFFSMSEIALVTVRKTWASELAPKNKKAKAILDLKHNPENLFATIQIGISVITIAASAFAGANIAERVALLFADSKWSILADNAGSISLVLVVVLVSYINITIGELVPKSLGLRFSEKMALLSARPILFLSKAFKPFIVALSFTSNLILKIFHDSTNFTEGKLSQAEIRSMISEGKEVGTVEPHEFNMIENVFNFSDLDVEKIMVPRNQIFALNQDLSNTELVGKAIESRYSRIPIYKGELNNIIGILYTQKLLAVFGQDIADVSIERFITPPYFVPSVMKISEVLQFMQKNKIHIALVTDEHGDTAGMVTLEDVLEEIVGDISDETDEDSNGIKKENDGFLVVGSMSVVDFNKFFKSDLPEDEDYNSVSGLIVSELGRFPKERDVVDKNNIKFTVKEIARRTVKSVFVTEIK